MQFTYYNQTQKHINVFRGEKKDYIGYFEPNAMITFEIDVKQGQAVLVKQWAEDMILIMPVDMQPTTVDKPGATPPPIPQEYVDLGNKAIKEIDDYTGGGEP